MTPLELTNVTPALQAHAARAYPRECCGALVRGADGALEVRALQNVAPEPTRHFFVSARDTLRLAEEDVVGLYHSHPDGPATPSAEDLAHAWEGTWLVVVPVQRGVAGAPTATFIPRGGRPGAGP